MPRKTATPPSPLGTAYDDPTNTFGPRKRFNWGYHDGASCARDGIDRIPSADYDLPYFIGHYAGRRDYAVGEYTENSDAAWKAFVAESKPERIAAMRKASIEAYLAYYRPKFRDAVRLYEACAEADGYGLN